MRNILMLTLAAFTIMLSSCFKDDCKSVRRIYRPVYKTLSEVRRDMKGGNEEPIVATGKIYLYDNYIFLNEPGRGIHVINNSNPSAPENISFINIPGNYDLAVKDNYLYADSYSDLVVFDISDPEHVIAKEFENNVFPQQNMYYFSRLTVNPDSILLPVDFIAIDTLVDCQTYDIWMRPDYNASRDPSLALYSNAPSTGIGGSTARFTVINDYLYTVDYATLYAFNIENASSPQLANFININTGFVETIYPFEEKLFIGSRNGMFIYDVSSPATPGYVGEFGHVQSCDPVIADGDNAFVTLRSGSLCEGFTNQLEVLDIKTNITNPLLLKTYTMTNPRGLAKDNDLLFICDGPDGLKLYDASDINHLSLKQRLRDLEPNDVIAYNKIALVIATDGLYQYDYSNASSLKLLSKIPVREL